MMRNRCWIKTSADVWIECFCVRSRRARLTSSFALGASCARVGFSFFSPGGERPVVAKGFGRRFESDFLSLARAVETVFAFVRVQINLWKRIFSSSRRSLNSCRISHRRRYVHHRFDKTSCVLTIRPLFLFFLTKNIQTRRLSPSRDVLSKKSVSTPS